ncbi:MAG: DNA helicase [Leptolyngbyaceae cyanobacterium SM1_3_5]|nr:DNA helicase [Leptolyngbyaceae cyanobacterium SM1_3_5]
MGSKLLNCPDFAQMNDQEKYPLIVQAWIDYTYREDMAKAEVEAARYSQPQVWTDGVSLVGNCLTIEPNPFEQLKAQSQTDLDFHLSLSFPQIFFARGGMRVFLPLFAIDVTSIFSGEHREQGWNVEEFAFQAIGENLMRLYHWEEEEIQNLVTKEGLSMFLQTTFGLRRTRLQTLLNQIDLPDSDLYSSRRAAYLLSNKLSFANRSLRLDLRECQQRPHLIWSNPQAPGRDYLFGQPATPQPEVLYFGVFPDLDAPTLSQAQVLKQCQNNWLIAVQGPPGSGKTFVILHKIAQQVVWQAIAWVMNQQDTNGLTLVTSTNNAAVDNVKDLLQSLDGNPVYLPGGNREVIEKETLPALQAKMDWLRRTSFDEAIHQQARQELIARVEKLRQAEADFLRQQQQAIEVDQQAGEQTETIAELQAAIQALQVEMQTQQDWLDEFTTYGDFPLKDYRQIQFRLQQAEVAAAPVEARRQRSTWLMRLSNWLRQIRLRLQGRTQKQLLQRFNRQSEATIFNIVGTSFPVQVPQSWSDLMQLRDDLTEQIDRATTWQAKHRAYVRQEARLQQLQQDYSDKTAHPNGNPDEASLTNDFYECFPAQYHIEQQELFVWAWKYLQQESLRRKAAIIPALELYTDAITRSSDARRRIKDQGEAFYCKLSLAFPVVTSTLQSVRNMFPHVQAGIIRCAIADEAGMTLPHQLFPVLVRAQQSLVVGDPLQLEPVMPLGQGDQDKFNQQAFLDRGLNSIDIDRFSPTSVQTATAYHRAAGASGEIGNLGSGIRLTEHFRSVKSIAEFFDVICQYGLDVKTTERASPLGSHLLAYHVEGSQDRQVNEAEVEAIEAIIDHLIAEGYSLRDAKGQSRVGVISPFRQQAIALQRRLHSRLSSQEVNTVHKFQGGQKEVIIFSPRQCRSDDSFWFINRTPNLLNVTVSRSQILFILVGNLDVLRNAGGYTAQLVAHIERHGEIRELPR